MTAELGELASQTGLFPCFRKRKGEPGELRHVPEAGKRPKVDRFLAGQRRFEHIVTNAGGDIAVRPGHEAELAAIQS